MLRAFYVSIELSYSLLVCYLHLIIPSQQSSYIPRNSSDKGVYGRKPFKTQGTAADEKEDGSDLMGSLMGSNDHGKYRTTKKLPTPSQTLPIQEVKQRPNHEGN